MKTIKLTISPAGKVQIETSGFSGSACQAATQQLESKLGITHNEQLTQEYYQDATQTNENQQ